MTVPADADGESLRILYNEASRTLDRQLATVESWNTRAAALVALVGAVLAVVAAMDPRDETRTVKVLLAAAAGVFVVAGFMAIRSWRVQKYRDDPRLDVRVTQRLLGLKSRLLLAQLLSNRLGALKINEERIAERRRDFQIAGAIALIGVGLMISVLGVRLLQEPSVPAVSIERADD